MRKFLVAGNWKMNGSVAGIAELLQNLLSGAHDWPHMDFAVFPPYLYLQQVSAALAESGISCGGQNVSQYDEGAVTGEVSAQMLLDLGCRYVLAGHSERRSLLNETNQMVADKVHKSLLAGLQPIVCVGETLEQREAGLVVQVITEQLQPVLDGHLDPGILSHLVVAYEPVWAIGTGRHATPEQAQAVHHDIRQFLVNYDAGLAGSVRIIYGGSVKASNAAGLFEMPDIDGALVGGASLDAEEFLKIGALCNQSCS